MFKNKKENNITGVNIYGRDKVAIVRFDDGSTFEIRDKIIKEARNAKIVAAEKAELKKLQEIAPVMFAEHKINEHDEKVIPFYHAFLDLAHKNDDVIGAAETIMKEMK